MSWLVFSAYNKLFCFEIINVLFLIWESGSKELDDMCQMRDGVEDSNAEI